MHHLEPRIRIILQIPQNLVSSSSLHYYKESLLNNPKSRYKQAEKKNDKFQKLTMLPRILFPKSTLVNQVSASKKSIYEMPKQFNSE